MEPSDVFATKIRRASLLSMKQKREASGDKVADWKLKSKRKTLLVAELNGQALSET